jgi:hypothetical protein
MLHTRFELPRRINARVLYDRSARANRPDGLVTDRMHVASENQFHAIPQAQLELFEFDFGRQVFGIQIGGFDDLLELDFTAGVFFGEVAKFWISCQQGLP